MNNQTEAKIIARIEELLANESVNFSNICDLLLQVKKHYLHVHPAYCWYREVAAKKLLPETVTTFVMKKGYLKHLCGYSRELQKTLVQGGEFDWVTVVKGEIVEKRTDWKAMKADAFKRMFPIGGPVRTVSEQRAILQAELDAAPKTYVNRQPIVRVDLEKEVVSIGNHRPLPLNAVFAALREVGIEFTLPAKAA